MAIARVILVLRISAPDQRQARTKGFMIFSSIKLRPKFLAFSKVTFYSRAANTEDFRSVYVVFSYHDSYPLCGRVREWVIRNQ